MLSTNAVDVLYAGFPAILYLNPDLGQYLLRPILEAQVSDDGSVVGQPYAPQNIGKFTRARLFSRLKISSSEGSQFPNVTGNFSPHNLGIEGTVPFEIKPTLSYSASIPRIGKHAHHGTCVLSKDG